MKSIDDMLAEAEEAKRKGELSTPGQSPAGNLAPQVAAQPFLLSALSSELVAELSALGEELLEPRALLRPPSGKPGDGLRVLGGCPGKLLGVLSKRQAQEAGRRGGKHRAASQTSERLREIANLGVAARQQKREHPDG